jgi:hypothetical protein
MLTKRMGPDGPYWEREKFNRGSFTASPHRLEGVASWRGQMSFEDLLVERGGPFAGSFDGIDRFQRDGREWVRFCEPMLEYCFDVEVTSDGEMGEIVPVPPEEAWRIALERDAKRGVRIVMEE